MYHKILLRSLILALTSLGLVSCLSQDENIQASSQTSDKSTIKQNTTTQNTSLPQGMTVAVDPTTGELRAPTAEEKQELRFQERQLQGVTSGSGASTLKEETLPDGTVMIDLKGQFQHQIKAEMVTIKCEKNNDTNNKKCSQKED